MSDCPTCGGAAAFPTEQMNVWGPWAWGILHQTVETLPCPSCREKGTAGLRAMHDMANVGLGKAVFDKENLLTVADLYTAVAKDIRSRKVVVEQKEKIPAHIDAVGRAMHEEMHLSRHERDAHVSHKQGVNVQDSPETHPSVHQTISPVSHGLNAERGAGPGRSGPGVASTSVRAIQPLFVGPIRKFIRSRRS